jgi:hypothetical protein
VWVVLVCASHPNVAMQTLATIRGDLQSITLERTIMETMMRPKIIDSRRILAQRRTDNEKVLHKRYTHKGTESTASKTTAGAPAASAKHNASAALATGGLSRQGRSGNGAADTVRFDRAAELLNNPIHIPQYDPNAVRSHGAGAPSAQPLRPTPGGGAGGATGYINPAAGSSSRLAARSVAGSILVGTAVVPSAHWLRKVLTFC